MIDRMTFYRSFCEKVKEGFVFTQIKKEKCRGFFWFSVTGGLIHHGGLNLCAFSSLRDITFFGNDFLNPLWSGFFLFTWGLGWQIRRIYTSMTPGKAGGMWNVVVVRVRRGGRYFTYFVSHPSGLWVNKVQQTPGFTRGHNCITPSEWHP